MNPAPDQILVVPVRGAADSVAEMVARRIGDALGVPAVVLHQPVDASAAFDEGRRQFHSTTLLDQLRQIGTAHEKSKVIGLISDDLFIPVLTFVFGEAQLGGRAAVVSSYRLRNEYYGLPHDDAIYRERIVKECLHELGHTLGLTHCPDYACVMSSSTSVEGIDLKQAQFCNDCRAQQSTTA